MKKKTKKPQRKKGEIKSDTHVLKHNFGTVTVIGRFSKLFDEPLSVAAIGPCWDMPT